MNHASTHTPYAGYKYPATLQVTGVDLRAHRHVAGVPNVPAPRFFGDDESIDLVLFLMAVSTAQHHHLAPSAWVVRWAALIPQGARVLDLACGNGRHMQWLKNQGLQVTGIDINPLAIEQSSAFGDVLEADLEKGDWPFAAHQFDAVVVTNYLWRPLFQSIQASIKPGGLLIYETFATGNESLGKPANPAFLLNTLELITGFPQLTPVAYENGRLESPPRIVQRVCAYKPTGPHQGQTALPLMDSLKSTQQLYQSYETNYRKHRRADYSISC